MHLRTVDNYSTWTKHEDLVIYVLCLEWCPLARQNLLHLLQASHITKLLEVVAPPEVDMCTLILFLHVRLPYLVRLSGSWGGFRWEAPLFLCCFRFMPSYIKAIRHEWGNWKERQHKRNSWINLLTIWIFKLSKAIITWLGMFKWSSQVKKPFLNSFSIFHTSVFKFGSVCFSVRRIYTNLCVGLSSVSVYPSSPVIELVAGVAQLAGCFVHEC